MDRHECPGREQSPVLAVSAHSCEGSAASALLTLEVLGHLTFSLTRYPVEQMVHKLAIFSELP